LLRPSLRALRKAFPEATIEALVTAGTAQALDDCPWLDRVIEWPRRAWLREAGLLLSVAGSGYDWVVDYTGNDRSALVAATSRAPVRAVYDRPKLPAWHLRRAAYTHLPKHPPVKPHILLQRLGLLEALGVPSQGTEIGLVPRQDAMRWAKEALQDLPKPLFHAHLTSRDMQKALPVPVAREVFAALQAQGYGIVVTHGPAKEEWRHVASAVEGLPRASVRVFGEIYWHQLVALVASCDQSWSADTAPAHVAAALEKPLLVHYGPSRAEHWYPLHAKGHHEVHPCTCLKKKQNTCPHGLPGKCLAEGMTAARVLALLRQAQG
jgi:ADP-heptose:LPS heptosyltransferase